MEIKLNYAHICDLAFVSDGGKANIIGIFKSITSSSFPVTHPKFSVITSFSVSNGLGDHKQTIKILDKNNREVEKEMTVDVNVSSKEQEINFIWDIVAFRFDRAGSYFLKMFFDEKEVFSIPLDLLKV